MYVSMYLRTSGERGAVGARGEAHHGDGRGRDAGAIGQQRTAWVHGEALHRLGTHTFAPYTRQARHGRGVSRDVLLGPGTWRGPVRAAQPLGKTESVYYYAVHR